MKKGIFILTVLTGLFIYSLNTSCNSINAKADAFPVMLQRTDTLGNPSEFNQLQELYTKYTDAIKKDSNDDLSRIKLVALYINEARITGNLSYYNCASLKLLNNITDRKLVRSDILYQAMVYKATVLLSLHQFTEAKQIAEKAVQLNSFDADIYGALADANVELGNYDEAVKMCEKMIGIRPDIRSYSRISYIRQIFGDNQGAIAAMRMAVESGAQGMENTEWARVQLGDLYLNTGHADTAKMLYESSLYARPNYPYAEMGLARMYTALKQYDSAIAHCKNAIRTMSESSFVSYLGDLYKMKGDVAKAKEVHQDVLNLILEGEKENEKEIFAKHNGNRELANAYLNTKRLKEALTYAKKDLALRPNNIDANELVAWIYYLQNQKELAKTHIDKAMITKSNNAGLLYKAALIYSLAGNETQSLLLRNKSLEINKGLQTESLLASK